MAVARAAVARCALRAAHLREECRIHRGSAPLADARHWGEHRVVQRGLRRADCALPLRQAEPDLGAGGAGPQRRSAWLALVLAAGDGGSREAAGVCRGDGHQREAGPADERYQSGELLRRLPYRWSFQLPRSETAHRADHPALRYRTGWGTGASGGAELRILAALLQRRSPRDRPYHHA